MRLKSDCIVCLVERAKYECDMIFKDDDAKIAAMNEILRFLVSHLSDKGKGKGKGGGGTPAFFGTERERILKRRSGMIDPHEHVKRRSNEVAKELLPVAIDFFSSHHDGIEALVRIAAAANSMEYGVRGYSYDDAAFKADFMHVLRERLNWDRDLILSAIRERDRIVYLMDNAGEVFFDAFVAKAHGIPFYVAAPISSFDLERSYKDVEIEQRSPRELIYCANVQLAPEEVKVYNPAFDFTPFELIAGVITEKGVLRSPPSTSY